MRPTSAQIRTWEQFKAEAHAVELLNRALVSVTDNAMAADNFGKTQGIDLTSRYGPLYRRAEQLSLTNARLSRVVAAVDAELLGVRFRPTGDFDILAPETMSSDELAQYNLNGFGWVLIAVGVVVVASAVAWIAWLRKENNELVEDYNALLAETDQRYCADPSSSTCRAWLARKSEVKYDQKQAATDDLVGQAKAIGKTILRGAQWGLIVAIPLLAWLLFGRRNA